MAQQHSDTRPDPDGRRRGLQTLAVALPVLALLVATSVSGYSAAALLVLAAVGLAVGVVGVYRRGNRALRIRSRRGAVTVAAVGLVGMAVGGTAFGSPTQHPEVPAVAEAPAAVQVAKARTAVSVLASLRVKGRAPMTGYDRAEDFGPAWLDVDRNGCDTRNDILRRDLVDIRGTRCKVLSGVLHDPYTRTTIRFTRGATTSTAVQIDHIVPLAAAWRTGAQRLTLAQRAALANDPINLFAVDGPTNGAKSDGDAATWLPKAKAFRCTYVAHQIGVKAAYGLWVTKAEKAAMVRVLRKCPTVVIPVSTTSKLVGPGLAASTPAPTATPTATATATTQPSAGSSSGGAGVVHPGAYCSPAGETGRTVAGTAMVCRTGSDGRLRWGSAA